MFDGVSVEVRRPLGSMEQTTECQDWPACTTTHLLQQWRVFYFGVEIHSFGINYFACWHSHVKKRISTGRTDTVYLVSTIRLTKNLLDELPR